MTAFSAASIPFARGNWKKWALKSFKRTVPPLLALYFIPQLFACWTVCGLLDWIRNRPITLRTFDRYFFGNGVPTWLLAPFNLLMDLFTLPYLNRGIYALDDLPAGYRDELERVIRAAGEQKLVEKMAAKLGNEKRGMMFFKWYGKNVETSVDMPAYHEKYRYVKTIGVSIFNRRQTTGEHFGPLRITLRALYNINDVQSEQIYIQVGDRVHRWKDERLFIFDDTLQHQSKNDSDEVRYCLFIDLLRPSAAPWLLSAVLAVVRVFTAQVNRVFYQHWTFLK